MVRERPGAYRVACAVAGCERPVHARGWCTPHYQRFLRHGSPRPDVPIRSSARTCTVDGCDAPHYARDLCEKHYRRWNRTGNVHVIARPDGCQVEGCDRPVDANGRCHGHDQRFRRRGDVDAATPLGRRRQAPVCEVDGCRRDAHARGWCRTHLARYERHGDVLADVPVQTAAGEGHEQHGYWYIPVPAELRWLTNGDTPVAEHRLQMAQYLGRPLEPDEVVHHRNGDRQDNRIVNLELWSVYQPKGQRVTDKVHYAVEILRRYAPHLLASSDTEPPATGGPSSDVASQDGDLSGR